MKKQLKHLINRIGWRLVESTQSRETFVPNDYISALETEVWQYVKMIPNQRCYQIDKGLGLNTHHQWITKGILSNLVRSGRINTSKGKDGYTIYH